MAPHIEANRDWPVNLEQVYRECGFETSPEQIQLITQVASRWVSRGPNILPGGKNQMLWSCCDHAAQCWKGKEEQHDPEGNRGGITLPWIGPRYPENRIAVLGLNLVNSGALLDELNITASTVEAFSQGKKTGIWPGNHTAFPYRTDSMLAAILARAAGQPLPESPPDDPGELVETILRTARVQAVKCSPWNSDASKPTHPMVRNCRRAVLPAELEILNPRVLLVAHHLARDGIAELSGWPTWIERKVNRTRVFSAGRARIGTADFAMLSVLHPSDRGGLWNTSWDCLIEHLGTDDPFFESAEA